MFLNRISRFTPHMLALCLVSLSLLFPAVFITKLHDETQAFIRNFDWLILLSSTGFVFLCGWLAFGPYGNIRLGNDDDLPRYGTLSWLAMLFAAGMGAGLMFWGTAEPLMYFFNPPPASDSAPETADAARAAMSFTLLHWALHPWAIYAVSALTIAFFTFRKGQPLLPSAPMLSEAGPRWHPLARIADMVAMMAVLFGVVASLGAGVLQISEGLQFSFDGVRADSTTLSLIMLTLFIVYMVSAMGGVNRGIKLLSNLNLLLCILLMLFLLAIGPTVFILQSVVTGLGDYLSRFVELSFSLNHYSGEQQWTHDWTLTNFLWWISWGPFVGVFIARISRGRTIREFITGVVIIPSLFTLLWFAIMGATGLHLALFENISLGLTLPQDAAKSSYALLSHFPLAAITQLLTVFLVFIFLVTSADSGTYVMGMFSSNGMSSPPLFQRLFWGIVLGVFTTVTLISGEGITLMRTFAAAGAIPFLFIMLWQCGCLIRSLRREPAAS